MKIIYRRFSLLLIILIMASLASCQRESYNPPKEEDKNETDVKFSFNFDENRSAVESQSVKKLKAGDNSQVTAANIKVFLFKKDGDKEVFIYKPEKITLTNRDTDPNKTVQYSSYIANFKVPDESVSFYDSDPPTKVRMVMVANYTGRDPNKGETYEDFDKSLVINLSGKYDESKTPIPFWGNCYLEFRSSRRMEGVIGLLRCMARINISIADDQKKDSRYSIASIESTHIYRTWNKATLSVPDDNLSINEEIIVSTKEPVIPQDVEFNLGSGKSSKDQNEADKDPLVYTYKSVQKVEPIYVPEKEQKAETITPEAMKKAMAVVVGVKLKDKNGKLLDKTKFYRVDIAKYEDKTNPVKPSKIMSIRRNHSYNIKLHGVSGSGGHTADEALKGNPSIYVSIKDWNIDSLNYELNGQYIFGIKSSNIKLQWKKDEELKIPVTHELNAHDAKQAVAFSWKRAPGDTTSNSKYFDAKFDWESKKLIISTKTENPTNNDITEQLSIHFLNHSFTFNVTQLHKPAQYEISPKTKVNGVYVVGRELNSTNTVTIRLYAKLIKDANPKEYARIENLRFHVESDTIEGYSITVDSIFNQVVKPTDGSAPYQDFTIPVSGKTKQPKDKVLTLKTDAVQSTLAEANIPLAFTPKTVLVLYGASVDLGDKLFFNDEDFKRMMKGNDDGSGVNFGLSTESVVKAEKITFVESSDKDLEKLIKEKKPDIIIHCKSYTLNGTQEQTLLKYMETNPTSVSGRGVLISFNTPDIFHFMRFVLKLGDEKDPNHSDKNVYPRWINCTDYERNKRAGRDQYGNLRARRKFFAIYNVNDQAKKNKVDIGYRYRIETTANDKVTTGPFGNIGGMWYRSNPTEGYYITYLDKKKIVKYGGMVPFGCGAKDHERERYSYGTTFCRAYKYPFIWNGFKNIGIVYNKSKDEDYNAKHGKKRDAWYFSDKDYAYDASCWKFQNEKLTNYDNGSFYCENRKVEPNTAALVSNNIIIANLLYWALYTSEYGI